MPIYPAIRRWLSEFFRGMNDLGNVEFSQFPDPKEKPETWKGFPRWKQVLIILAFIAFIIAVALWMVYISATDP